MLSINDQSHQLLLVFQKFMCDNLVGVHWRNCSESESDDVIFLFYRRKLTIIALHYTGDKLIELLNDSGAEMFHWSIEEVTYSWSSMWLSARRKVSYMTWKNRLSLTCIHHIFMFVTKTSSMTHANPVTQRVKEHLITFTF